MPLLDEYTALSKKVDAFSRAVHAARPDDLACREGCDGCCHVHLSVCEVEAAAIRACLDSMDDEARSAIAEQARRNAAAEEPRCAFLNEDGACSIYSARPLVCRTQGLPLRYAAGVIPVEAVMGHGGGGELTWCPLNFTERAPDPANVLDAERVDAMLALVNRRYCEGTGMDPMGRVELSELASR